MNKFYAQFGADGVVFSVLESGNKPDSPNVKECEGRHVLGQKWDGAKFVVLPAVTQYKIWSKPQFILSIGKTAFDAIIDGADKDLRFAKYVLDSADAVDMNVPDYVSLVDLLRTKNLITAAKLAEIKAQV
ncbi:MAG: hypothetical protein AAGC78_10340 [Cellvibrio sp.]|uniref:hypothetical protein n=1 Tax=Cellvibrio sp. TaxID=1965322 RepID=UPI0031A9A614